jgi:hypothetical protein
MRLFFWLRLFSACTTGWLWLFGMRPLTHILTRAHILTRTVDKRSAAACIL